MRGALIGFFGMFALGLAAWSFHESTLGILLAIAAIGSLFYGIRQGVEELTQRPS